MNIVTIYETFPTNADCIKHLERVRWGDTPKCPYCGSDNNRPLPGTKRHQCRACKTSFSVTVRTIFHHTHLPLQKWFLAVAIILNAKKGLSARQLARDICVNKDTAWRMAMKIREAMSERWQRRLLTGIVEADETYIGGKPRKGSGKVYKRGRGTWKTPVVGLVERDKGKVRAEVFKHKRLTARNLKALVRKNVDLENATLMTDEYKGYIGMNRILPHKVVDHTVWYVDGDKHTNTMESFWALLKRGIVGQYHKVSIRYLYRYIDEFSYRWNNRETENLFNVTLFKAVGGPI